MKTINAVQPARTPLHQQLLVLIPVLKVIEDHRASAITTLPPLLLEVAHHDCGSLTLDLSDAPDFDDGRLMPELTLAIYKGSHSRTPLTYNHAFAFAWTYLSSSTPMNSVEYEALYKTFFLSWAIHLFEYEQNLKTLDLA